MCHYYDKEERSFILIFLVLHCFPLNIIVYCIIQRASEQK